jgi:hypothetical protein
MTLLEEDHPQLIHYTGAAGLSGILESQTLHATHYSYLNDATEVRHFLSDRLPGMIERILRSINFDEKSAAREGQVWAENL